MTDVFSHGMTSTIAKEGKSRMGVQFENVQLGEASEVAVAEEELGSEDVVQQP
jgi:hypothetical protein